MRFRGKYAGFEVGDGLDPIISGVINLSPESYYKKSIETNKAKIKKRTMEMINDGAQIIDVGALSTRPVSIYGGSKSPQKEELKRIEQNLPFIIEIAKTHNIPVSIDTQSVVTAGLAIDLGCTVVNDISGLKSDPKMAKFIAKQNVDLIIMATNQKPGDPCGITETITALDSSIKIAQGAGISMDRIAIDPAFGGWGGKHSDCDLQLIQKFAQFQKFKMPIYVGISRKSTIKTLGGGEFPEDRLPGSLILTQWLVEHGAHIIRTHDVKETVLSLCVANKLKKIVTN